MSNAAIDATIHSYWMGPACEPGPQTTDTSDASQRLCRQQMYSPAWCRPLLRRLVLVFLVNHCNEQKQSKYTHEKTEMSLRGRRRHHRRGCRQQQTIGKSFIWNLIKISPWHLLASHMHAREQVTHAHAHTTAFEPLNELPLFTTKRKPHKYFPSFIITLQLRHIVFVMWLSFFLPRKNQHCIHFQNKMK